MDYEQQMLFPIAGKSNMGLMADSVSGKGQFSGWAAVWYCFHKSTHPIYKGFDLKTHSFPQSHTF